MKYLVCKFWKKFILITIVLSTSSLCEFVFVSEFSKFSKNLIDLKFAGLQALVIIFFVKIILSFMMIWAIQATVADVQRYLVHKVWNASDQNRDILLKRNIEFFCFNYFINYIRIVTEGIILLVLITSAAVVCGPILSAKVFVIVSCAAVVYIPIVVISRKTAASFKAAQSDYFLSTSDQGVRGAVVDFKINRFIQSFKNIYVLMLSQRLIIELMVMVAGGLLFFSAANGLISKNELLLVISVFTATGIKILSSLNVFTQSFNSVLALNDTVHSVKVYLK